MTTHSTLTPADFAAKWQGTTTTEKAGSQEHFIDLCRMLGQPTPNEADPTGESYAFEKAVTKAAGGDGFADVWKKDFFGWEYKGKRKDLKAAYLQLLGNREDLGNPPLLVVSDLDSIEIRTNFTNLSPKLYTVTSSSAGKPTTVSTRCRIVTTTTRRDHGPSSPDKERAGSQSLFMGSYRPRIIYRPSCGACQ